MCVPVALEKCSARERYNLADITSEELVPAVGLGRGRLLELAKQLALALHLVRIHANNHRLDFLPLIGFQARFRPIVCAGHILLFLIFLIRFGLIIFISNILK